MTLNDTIRKQLPRILFCTASRSTLTTQCKSWLLPLEAMAFEVLQSTVRLNPMVGLFSSNILTFHYFIHKLFCAVPEAPTDVKALVMGHSAILVSWRPPAQPNGIIQQYTVYSKVEGGEGEPKGQKIPHYQMSFEATDLEKNKPYEFWVTANTNIGEGQPSKSIVAMPSDQVPAKIASFDDTFTATFKEDAKMPCLVVGAPQPEITWKIKGIEFTGNDRMRLMPDGALLIKSVNRQDAGDYTCHAENSIAKDSITHKLIVLAPPQSPQVTLSATTTDSLTVKLKPHEGDTAPLHGYTIHYKPGEKKKRFS